MADDWVTVSTAAKTVKKSVATIGRWARDGDVKTYWNRDGWRLVYLPDVIEAAAKKRPGRTPKNVSNVITS